MQPKPRYRKSFQHRKFIKLALGHLKESAESGVLSQVDNSLILAISLLINEEKSEQIMNLTFEWLFATEYRIGVYKLDTEDYFGNYLIDNI